MEHRKHLVTTYTIAFVMTILVDLFHVWVEYTYIERNKKISGASDTMVQTAFIILCGAIALSVLFDAWILSVCKSWVAEGKRLIKE